MTPLLAGNEDLVLSGGFLRGLEDFTGAWTLESIAWKMMRMFALNG